MVMYSETFFLGVQVKYTVCPCPGCVRVQVVSMSGLRPVRVVSVRVVSCPGCVCPGCVVAPAELWGGACSFDLSVRLALAPICQPNQNIFDTQLGPRGVLYLDLKCLSVCPCWDKDKAHFKKSNFYILPS